jgi:hypothetical protein
MSVCAQPLRNAVWLCEDLSRMWIAHAPGRDYEGRSEL